MKKIAIIGMGYWGKNLIREFSKLCVVSTCVTLGNQNNRKWLKKNYPDVEITNNLNKVLSDDSIESVVIATPIDTHYDLTLKALKNKKHVFVEKPISKKFTEGKKLLDLAKKNNLTLFVGYEFMYHQIFDKIKVITKNDPIKSLVFNWLQNSNSKENIIYDLVSHEVSILLKFLGIPKIISSKQSIGINTSSDLISFFIKFNKNVFASIYVNRINEIKRKSILISTQKNTFLWLGDELFKFNKNGISFNSIFKQTKTPLEIECFKFLNLIDKTPNNYSNPEHALLVTKYLEKIQHLKN